MCKNKAEIDRLSMVKREKMTLCFPCGPAGYLTGLYIILLDEL